MSGHAERCVAKYEELAGVKAEDLKQVATPCMDDHIIPPEDFEAKGELSNVAARIVLTVLFLARTGRPDLLWTVNTLARETTRWNVACDKRLHRLISYIQHTKHHVHHCFVGDDPHDCWIAVFSDASFAGDLRDSKSTSGCYLCLVGPRTFVPITWFAKKQGAVSHSSTEAEIISLDACLRMEGIPCLVFWSQVVQAFPGPTSPKKVPNQESGNARSNVFDRIDHVTRNVPFMHNWTKLFVFEDNDAVVKICVKGRAPQFRHVLRTHRIDLDWLFERLQSDPDISMRFVGTKEQLADIFTKGSFTAAQWKDLLRLIGVGPINM